MQREKKMGKKQRFLSESQVAQILQLRGKGGTRQKGFTTLVAKQFNVSSQSIRRVSQPKAYQHGWNARLADDVS